MRGRIHLSTLRLRTRKTIEFRMKTKLKHLGNRDYESTVKYVKLSNWSIRYAFNTSLLLFKCQQNKSKQLAKEKDKK